MGASVARIDGVLSADLNFASATLLVEYDPGADPLQRVVAAVEASGHGLRSLDESGADEVVSERRWLDRHLTEIATAGSGGFAAVGAVAAATGVATVVTDVVFAVAIIFGGLLVWRRALNSLRARMLDMNVLMSIAVLGAAALGQWGEAATVFFLFALGGLLESRSLERTRRSIRDLMDLSPQMARVRLNGELAMLDVSSVMPGTTIVVRPGERVALDGIVVRGSSAVDESPITGESVPADKSEGDRVFAGTLNASGLLEVQTTTLAADSTLSRIVYLVEEAQGSRAPSQTFVERFSRWYTPLVIWLALGVAVVPPLVAAFLGVQWGPWSEWVRRALVMLVVSCPCALVISTPVSIVSAITRASRDGVLVKGGAFLEAAAEVQAIAFDKTGTLTLGKARVVGVEPFGDRSEAGVLAVAAALEGHSNHPIARAVVSALEEVRSRPAGVVVEEYQEEPGVGVSGLISGVRWEICSPACAHERGTGNTAEPLRRAGEAEQQGRTVLALLEAGEIAGLLSIVDGIRPQSAAAIAALKRGGIEHLIMLTGDNERVAEAVAGETGLTGILSRLLPEAKVDAVRTLRKRYGMVAMVGDGVNDAPALAAADIGIAMGAAGTDTALETADVALMRDDLGALAGFFALGRRTRSTIRVNVAFSIVVKIVFLVLALTGTATLWMAVFADTGVSLLVILNGMRLLGRRNA